MVQVWLKTEQQIGLEWLGHHAGGIKASCGRNRTGQVSANRIGAFAEPTEC